MLLHSELLSPQHIYPAHAEALRDVVLWLLGRTWAPPPPVMPATLLSLSVDSPLPADYRKAVHHAVVVRGPEGEKVHVPIQPWQSLKISKGEPVRIGSIIVTMDGRWWESERLEAGEQSLAVHRPMGRLRIDFSADHARLRVPWPETRLHWSGEFHLPQGCEIFGREWQLFQWEEDSERTWLSLVFSRILTMPNTLGADSGLRGLRPAFVDMAWAAMENALTNSVIQRSREPIEEMHHSDLVPLGRAIFGLTALLMSRRPTAEAVGTQLRAVGFLESQVSSVYGRVPWRILPLGVRAVLLRGCAYPAVRELTIQVFDEIPEVLSEVGQHSRSGNLPGPTAPPRAA
jgi:hypothetical protein